MISKPILNEKYIEILSISIFLSIMAILVFSASVITTSISLKNNLLIFNGLIALTTINLFHKDLRFLLDECIDGNLMLEELETVHFFHTIIICLNVVFSIFNDITLQKATMFLVVLSLYIISIFSLIHLGMRLKKFNIHSLNLYSDFLIVFSILSLTIYLAPAANLIINFAYPFLALTFHHLEDKI